MKFKILSAAALSFALLGGAAFAQTTSSTTEGNERGGEQPYQNQPFLGDKAKMGVFFTDESMGTMRSDTELRQAWDAMTENDRTAMRSDCEAIGKGGGEPVTDPSSPSVAKLCGAINSYQ